MYCTFFLGAGGFTVSPRLKLRLHKLGDLWYASRVSRADRGRGRGRTVRLPTQPPIHKKHNHNGGLDRRFLDSEANGVIESNSFGTESNQSTELRHSQICPI